MTHHYDSSTFAPRGCILRSNLHPDNGARDSRDVIYRQRHAAGVVEEDPIDEMRRRLAAKEAELERIKQRLRRGATSEGDPLVIPQFQTRSLTISRNEVRSFGIQLKS